VPAFYSAIHLWRKSIVVDWQVAADHVGTVLL
jgi:hypothetical protein